MPYGGVIAVHLAPGFPDNLRGDGLDLIGWGRRSRPSSTPKHWDAVLRPMLITSRGSALFLSTPHGRNWFWEFYNIGLDPPSKRNGNPSTSPPPPMNSSIPKNWSSVKRRTPEIIWQAEYLEAQFISAGSGVFRRPRASRRPRALQPLPQPGHAYVAGIDWGRSKDRHRHRRHRC